MFQCDILLYSFTCLKPSQSLILFFYSLLLCISIDRFFSGWTRLSSFSFHQIVKSVTHVNPSGLSSLIDLVFLPDLSRLCVMLSYHRQTLIHNGLYIIMLNNFSKPPQLRTVRVKLSPSQLWLQ